MTAHVLCHILVEGLLCVDHAIVLLISMEDREVDDEWIALASNQILRDDLIGAWVSHLSEVDAGW